MNYKKAKIQVEPTYICSECREEEPICDECGIDLIDEDEFYCNGETHLCEDCKKKLAKK
jgi:hypothetical protein